MANKTYKLVFNDDVTAEQFERIVDRISELLEEEDITAVGFAGEEEFSEAGDGEA